MEPDYNSLLIAPCGMNCGICYAYLRERNKCKGCRLPDDKKPVSRLSCKIKTCDVIENEKSVFCFECSDFPCDRLKHLDKRYRKKYGMSMFENLGNIRNLGMITFLRNEKSKWTCLKCGGTICVHKGKCSACGEMTEFKKTGNLPVS